jgi:glycosyltransferase involved in cell wall biosynthesis
MTFGKFGTYKRVETLVEAFSLLQTHRENALELVIAGTDSPNAPQYLANVAQQYAAVPNVRYTGYVAEEDVPIIFGAAAAVVFPYTSTTGSSGVLHQAGDYGKAVVLPKIGDLAELIAEEGYTGEFFEPGDAQSLADAIALILDHPDRRIEMGRQNYLAARGLPLADVLDWYLLHIELVLNNRKS